MTAQGARSMLQQLSPREHAQDGLSDSSRTSQICDIHALRLAAESPRELVLLMTEERAAEGV